MATIEKNIQYVWFRRHHRLCLCGDTEGLFQGRGQQSSVTELHSSVQMCFNLEKDVCICFSSLERTLALLCSTIFDFLPYTICTIPAQFPLDPAFIRCWDDFQRTWVRFPALTSGTSQPHLTPAPVESNVSGFHNICPHMHTPTHRHTHIRMIENNF